MKRTLRLCLMGVLTLASVYGQMRVEAHEFVKEGWAALLNGRDLAGWHAQDSKPLAWFAARDVRWNAQFEPTLLSAVPSAGGTIVNGAAGRTVNLVSDARFGDVELDFGGGQVTDLFCHWVDVVHMFSGECLPSAAVAAGGIYTYKDGRTAPDTIHVAVEYPGGFTATFDGALGAAERTSGAEFIGTGGRLVFDGPKSEYYPTEKDARPIVKMFPADPVYDHVNNFLACVKGRQSPNADVLIGHRAAQASHLCNIAYKEQKRIRFDPLREEILA